jgi:hypothetical protein
MVRACAPRQQAQNNRPNAGQQANSACHNIRAGQFSRQASEPRCKHTWWDFTLAIRSWTGGEHPNHGFMLHGDSRDYMIAHSREAKDIQNGPAVLVIYEPK